MDKGYPQTLAAAIGANAKYLAAKAAAGGDPAPYLAKIDLYSGRLAALAAPQAPAAPIPSAAWGAADLSTVATDTYSLAQQWYAVLSGTGTGTPAAVFTQGADYARGQLAQLLGGIIGSGAQYWPVSVYPEVPQAVLDAAGAGVDEAALAAWGGTHAQGTYSPRPEQVGLPAA